MPEVEYVTTMKLAPEAVWEFVKDMNNWAPFLTGYQKHVIENETDSVWTLKGDVGVLSRTVELRAHVTEWNGPEKVSFTLKGLNEVVEGGGTLLIQKPAVAPPPPKKKRSLWGRFVDSIFRFFFRLANGKSPKRLAPARAESASELVFTLRMEAGGPSGPLVNAMLAPALKPAAEDLANKIAAHLEKVHGLAS
jgi:carbon monoxide dehydrogenase subunit G